MSPTRKELALRFLRDKLASGALTCGSRLSDLALSKEMGISRTPVREAINQLAAEGMVEMRPHEGAFVRTLTRQDVQDLYELRQVLESYAAGRVAENREALRAVVDELRGLYQNLVALEKAVRASGRTELSAQEMAQQHETDFAFHRAIIHAAGNRRVERVIDDSRIYDQLFGSLKTPLTLKALKKACKFHHAVLCAIETGAAETARAAMAEHIHCGLQIRLAMMDAAPADDSVPEALRKYL